MRSFLDYAAIFWDRFSDRLSGKPEAILRRLLALSPDVSTELRLIPQLLEGVSRPRRMQLLKMVLENAKQYVVRLDERDHAAGNRKMRMIALAARDLY